VHKHEKKEGEKRGGRKVRGMRQVKGRHGEGGYKAAAGNQNWGTDQGPWGGEWYPNGLLVHPASGRQAVTQKKKKKKTPNSKGKRTDGNFGEGGEKNRFQNPREKGFGGKKIHLSTKRKNLEKGSKKTWTGGGKKGGGARGSEYVKGTRTDSATKKRPSRGRGRRKGGVAHITKRKNEKKGGGGGKTGPRPLRTERIFGSHVHCPPTLLGVTKGEKKATEKGKNRSGQNPGKVAQAHRPKRNARNELGAKGTCFQQNAKRVEKKNLTKGGTFERL